MQKGQTFDYKSECGGVFVVLPEQGNLELPCLLPLAIAKQPKSSAEELEVSRLASPPLSCISSSPASTSSGGSSPEQRSYDVFYANIERSYRTKVNPDSFSSTLLIFNGSLLLHLMLSLLANTKSEHGVTPSYESVNSCSRFFRHRK